MAVSRLQKGLALQNTPYFWANYPTPCEIVQTHGYVNDFDQYIAADWTVTTTTGSSALTAGNGGFLTQTTAASSSDIQANQKNPASFAVVGGEGLWFSCNVNVNDNVSGLIAGLTGGGTVFAPTNGIYFTKVTGNANINAVINNAGTSTTFTGITTITPGTPLTLSFYYDGLGTPTLYFFSSASNYVSGTFYGQTAPIGGNECGSMGALATSGLTLANLPLSTANLNLTFGIQAGAAAAKTAAWDYVFAGNQINRV
jgi:hypothetical protein